MFSFRAFAYFAQAYASTTPVRKIIFRVYRGVLIRESIIFCDMVNVTEVVDPEKEAQLTSATEESAMDAPFGMTAEQLGDLLDVVFFQ